MPKILDEPFSLLMDEGEEHTSFSTLEDLFEWVEGQFAALSTLEEAIGSPDILQHAHPVPQLFKIIRNAHGQLDHDDPDMSFQLIKDQLEGLRDYPAAYLPVHPTMVEALHLSMENRLAGQLRILRLTCRHKSEEFPPLQVLNNINPSRFASYMHAFVVEGRTAFFDEQAVAYRLQLENTLKIQRKLLSGSQKATANVRSFTLQQKKRAKRVLRAATRTYRGLREDQRSALQQQISEAEGRLTKMEEIQAGKLALGTSETLWEKRAQRHNTVAYLWLATLLVAFSVLGALAVPILMNPGSLLSTKITLDTSIILAFLVL